MSYSFKLLVYVSFFMLFTACLESHKTEENHTEPNTREDSLMDGNQPFHKHVAPGGVYSFKRPKNFGLAVSREQIMKKNNISSCKEGFDYCLYYKGNKYENTNFETAGVGFYILKNVGKNACVSANKYNGRIENMHTETINGIAFTVFSSGDAAMGHYAKDVVYQTFANNTCYRFIARIGSSQFQNYDPGTIEKFTPKMENEMRKTLKAIIEKIQFNPK